MGIRPRFFVAMLIFAGSNAAEGGVTVDQLGRILLQSNYTVMTQGYSLPGHAGIDFRAAVGTPLYAPTAGVVVASDIANGHLAITAGNGYTYIFLHLSQINKRVGDAVALGESIALTGRTLYKGVPISGPHLHIEVRTGGRSVPADPNVPSSYQWNVDPTGAVDLVLVDAVIDGPASLKSGTTGQFTATVLFNDLSKKDVTSTATWQVKQGTATFIGRGTLRVGSLKADEQGIIAISGRDGAFNYAQTKRVALKK